MNPDPNTPSSSSQPSFWRYGSTSSTLFTETDVSTNNDFPTARGRLEEHIRWLNFEAARNRDMQRSQRFTTLYGNFSGQSPSARYNPNASRSAYPASPNVLRFTPRRNTLDNIDDDLPRPQDYADNRDAVINRAIDSANEINQQLTPPPQPSTPPTPAAPSRAPSLSRIPPPIPFEDAGGTVPQTPSNVNP